MNVKGSALRSSLNYLRENFPPADVDKILDRLPPEQRKIFEKPVLVSDWFDAKVLYSLMKAMAGGSNQDPRALYHQMGRQSCDDGLNTVYKIFYKLGSPSYIIEKGMRVWNNYYSDGVIVTLKSTPKMAHIRLTKNSFPDESMCIRLNGWMERAVELSGGKRIRLSHPSCVHHGQEYCEWEASWE
jgi:hypothetical protein